MPRVTLSRRARTTIATLMVVTALSVPVNHATAADRAASTVSLSQAWSVAGPPGSGSIRIEAITALSSGVVVAGTVQGGALNGAVAVGGRDAFAARYDQSGALIWATQFGMTADDDVTHVVRRSSSVYVAGTTVHHGTTARAAFVSRLDLADGTFVWRRQFAIAEGTAAAIAPAADDGVIMIATALPLPSDATGPTMVVREYGPDGVAGWGDRVSACCNPSGVISGSGRDIAASEAPVVAVGVLGSADDAQRRTFVRDYDIDGFKRWTSSITAPTGDVVPDEVAVNQDGIVWVLGTSTVPITGAPDAHPAPNTYLRRYFYNGYVLSTKETAVARLAADCTSFLAIGSLPGAPGNQAGAFLERSSEDGVTQWRWEVTGTSSTRTSFQQVSRRGKRIYLTIAKTVAGVTSTRLAALDGAPAGADCDTTSPTVTAPRRGFVSYPAAVSSDGLIRLRVPWTGSDIGSGIARYELAARTDGGDWTSMTSTLQAPTATGVTPQVKPGHTYAYRVRAVDLGGNVSGWATGPTIAITRYQDTSTHLSYSGTWSTTSGPMFLGSTHLSTQAGAKASLTFSGRSIAWVARTGPDRGNAEVFVNGTSVAIVDLYSDTYRDRRVVWVGTWTTTASRKVSIKVLGTAAQPRVDLDALYTAN